MSTTRQIPRQEWTRYFDELTRRFFKDGNPEAATVEVISPDLGDQVAADFVRALGVAYDPRNEVLEVLLDGVDHLVYHPREVWVVEEDNGFVSTLEIVRDDDTREVVRFRSVGIAPRPDAAG